MPDTVRVVLPDVGYRTLRVLLGEGTAIGEPNAVLAVSLDGPIGPQGPPGADAQGAEGDPPVNLSILFENALV